MTAKQWDAFVSHATQDDAFTQRIEADLGRAGVRVWTDHASLRHQGPLLQALQDAILASRYVLLVWSASAEASRYVGAEWYFAWNRGIVIVPCVIDDTPLPLGLGGMLYCDFRTEYAKGLHQLVRALEQKEASAPVSSPAPSPAPPAANAQLQELGEKIYAAQLAALTAYWNGDLDQARRLSDQVEPLIYEALRHFPRNPQALNYAGYQRKNAYMVHHREEIEAWASRNDEDLDEAERLFYAVLGMVPDDPSALNGLATVLQLRRDLDAAEFFALKAVEGARKRGLDYREAEGKLALIRRQKAEHSAKG
jgi:tetratricopeptide (TPR) repeat protein